MTSTQHTSTQPSGKPGDTRVINDGAHQITQLRVASGWINLDVR